MTDCSKSVLIVDDNKTVRRVLRMFLEDTAHVEVCGEAADGTEAIERAKETKPGLILMDLSMPNMNGVEAASVIRKLIPKARIVVFTLHADVLGKSKAKFPGVDLVISKTEGAAGLMTAVRALLADPFGLSAH